MSAARGAGDSTYGCRSRFDSRLDPTRSHAHRPPDFARFLQIAPRVTPSRSQCFDWVASCFLPCIPDCGPCAEESEHVVPCKSLDNLEIGSGDFLEWERKVPVTGVDVLTLARPEGTQRVESELVKQSIDCLVDGRKLIAPDGDSAIVSCDSAYFLIEQVEVEPMQALSGCNEVDRPAPNGRLFCSRDRPVSTNTTRHHG